MDLNCITVVWVFSFFSVAAPMLWYSLPDYITLLENYLNSRRLSRPGYLKMCMNHEPYCVLEYDLYYVARKRPIIIIIIIRSSPSQYNLQKQMYTFKHHAFTHSSATIWKWTLVYNRCDSISFPYGDCGERPHAWDASDVENDGLLPMPTWSRPQAPCMPTWCRRGADVVPTWCRRGLYLECHSQMRVMALICASCHTFVCKDV